MTTVGIIGLGLIGGSFAKALKKSGKYRVLGYDISREVRDLSTDKNIVSGILDKTTAKDVEYLFAAVTPDNLAAAVKDFLPCLKDGATVTDLCGIKVAPVNQMKKWKAVFPNLKFFGGHPMAGKERYGIENSDENLFSGASMILTPIDDPIDEDFKKIFYSCGFSRITETDPDTHDSIIAYTSQLCHIVSSAFVKNETAQKHFGFSAGSLKDLTRVARLNPEMWSELIMQNKDKALKELKEFTANLSKYQIALENSDKDELKRLLSEGNTLKEKLDGEK